MKYYDWGNNCRVLGMSEEEAAGCLSNAHAFSQEDADNFWTGHAYGTSETVVSIDGY